MTTRSMYEFLCDAPHCEVTVIGKTPAETPDGWRTLRSTEHIPYVNTSVYPARRRQANVLSHGERCIGSFALNLCPQHHGTFDAHLPRTDGRPGTRGRSGSAQVACSCGVVLGREDAASWVGRPAGPSYNTERMWWRHLPESLRWYAQRAAAVSPTEKAASDAP